MNHEVYLHGQILGTHSFWLKDGFLEPDEYAEIKAKYFLPGGETGTATTVLASLGAYVKIDGTHIGTAVASMLFPKNVPVPDPINEKTLRKFSHSAIAISRFPLPLNPPTLEEVKELIGQ